MAHSANDIDFGSAGEEDYLEIHSPTDSSEDSVEVKVSPITSRNKRKCAEPRKVPDTFTGPLKKRMCLKVKAEVADSHPFRPWSPKPVPLTKSEPPCITPEKPVSDLTIKSETCIKDDDNIEDRDNLKCEDYIKSEFNSKCDVVKSNDDVKCERPQFPLSSFIIPKVPIIYQPNLQLNTHKYAYFRPPSPLRLPIDDQPVSLVKKSEPPVKIKEECVSDHRHIQIPQPPRVPIHPQITALSTAETERLIINTTESFPSLQDKVKADQVCSSRREQRNYKNMTRERRIEANARERTRVHTISAAFDTLRRSVPAYSHNQKLSKLSVLRIACSYIKTLSHIVEGNDNAASEGVDTVSRTIQREGKLRKKKDDND